MRITRDGAAIRGLPLRRLVESDNASGAFVIACYSDPGLHVCREGTQRPVFGIAECGVLTALARAERFGVIAILQRRNAWQVIDSVQRVDEPSQIADLAGYASYLSLEQKRELLETADVNRRLELVTEWAREHLAELEQLLGFAAAASNLQP